MRNVHFFLQEMVFAGQPTDQEVLPHSVKVVSESSEQAEFVHKVEQFGIEAFEVYYGSVGGYF